MKWETNNDLLVESSNWSKWFIYIYVVWELIKKIFFDEESTAERDEDGENHGSGRKSWEMKPKGGKRWREEKTWKTKRGRSRVRNIPRDEREGSPLEKMHCGWSPPEVEHSVAALGRVSFWSFSPNFCCLQLGLGFCFRD